MLWRMICCCGVLLALASCGGGASSSTEAVGRESSDRPSLDVNYGAQQDATERQRMAKRLYTYFGSEKGSLTESFAAASSTQQNAANNAAKSSPGTKRYQPAEFVTYRRIHRFFNTATGVHFYTASDAEKQEIQTSLPRFTYEGTAYRVLVGQGVFTVPVYRFYNRISGTHLYTASESEKNTVIQELSDVFRFEGTAWYARAEPYPGWVPVYRFFHRSTGTHFYTHSEAEKAKVLSTLPDYVLEGVAYWVRSDEAVDPLTWQPPVGSTPDEGNYVYFESQPGDFVGMGQQHLWTATDSQIQMVNRYDKILELSGQGYTDVSGYFFFPSALSDWKKGFYPNATRANWMLNTTLPNPGPGLDFSMDGRGCNETSGWIHIDQVSHDVDGSLAAFELRFEQLCQWSTDVLRGKIRWSKYDSVMPPGPVTPAPGNLWRPANGVVPESGGFVYLEGSSDSRSYSRLIRGSDSTTGQLGFSGSGRVFGGLIFETTSNETLLFSFESMWFTSKLVPGLYQNVTRTPQANPARGNLDFLYTKYSQPDESWGCGGGQWSDGWFVVDDVSYEGDEITSIQLRFERACLGSSEVTRGMIRWQSGD